MNFVNEDVVKSENIFTGQAVQDLVSTSKKKKKKSERQSEENVPRTDKEEDHCIMAIRLFFPYRLLCKHHSPKRTLYSGIRSP